MTIAHWSASWKSLYQDLSHSTDSSVCMAKTDKWTGYKGGKMKNETAYQLLILKMKPEMGRLETDLPVTVCISQGPRRKKNSSQMVQMRRLSCRDYSPGNDQEVGKRSQKSNSGELHLLCSGGSWKGNAVTGAQETWNQAGTSW